MKIFTYENKRDYKISTQREMILYWFFIFFYGFLSEKRKANNFQIKSFKTKSQREF